MLAKNMSVIKLLLIFLKISTTLCAKKNSLAFVIDDTVSMQYEIHQVIDAVDEIIDVMESKTTCQIEDLVLVTFNDPETRLLLKSHSRVALKNALTSIKTNGGGDCPEPALAGTKLGLQNSAPGSYLFTFTDDAPKDEELKMDVIRLCQEKQIQVLFLVTPSGIEYCRQRKHKNFMPFYEIAVACSGQVFQLTNKNEVSKVLPYVAEISKGPVTVSTAKIFTENVTSPISFRIDEQTKYAIVSTSGENISLNVVRGPTNVYEKIVWTKNVKIIKFSRAGSYVVDVSGAGNKSVIVYGRTDLNFRYNFSTNIPSNFDSVDMGQLTTETRLHLLVLIEDAYNSFEVQRVEILDMNENVIKELSLSQISGNYYATEQFELPYAMFKVAIAGKEVNTNKIIRRIAKTPNEPKTQKPKINKWNTNMEIIAHNSVSLACNVSKAYPEPTITWLFNNQVIGNGTVLHLTNISTSDSGKYVCIAENIGGRDIHFMQISVKEIPVSSAAEMEAIKVKKHKSIQIECQYKTIHDGTLKPKITWIFDGKVIASESILQLIDVTEKNSGMYTCIAEDSKGRHEYLVKVEVEENAITSAPKIDVTKVTLHNSVYIQCEYRAAITTHSVSTPKITWMFKGRIIASQPILHIVDVTEDNAGIYTCIAEDSEGRHEHNVQVDLRKTSVEQFTESAQVLEQWPQTFEPIQESTDYYFLMGILAEMEKLSSVQKLRLRSAINQALLDEINVHCAPKK